jgi:hypothetical protein
MKGKNMTKFEVTIQITNLEFKHDNGTITDAEKSLLEHLKDFWLDNYDEYIGYCDQNLSCFDSCDKLIYV